MILQMCFGKLLDSIITWGTRQYYINLLQIVESIDRYIVMLILDESDQSSKSDCLVCSKPCV